MVNLINHLEIIPSFSIVGKVYYIIPTWNLRGYLFYFILPHIDCNITKLFCNVCTHFSIILMPMAMAYNYLWAVFTVGLLWMLILILFYFQFSTLYCDQGNVLL